MGIEVQQVADPAIGAVARRIDDNSGKYVEYIDKQCRMVTSAFFSVARTDTAAKNGPVLPINAQVVDVTVMGQAVSNAGTTATISVGKSGTNTFFVNALDVKGSTGSGKARPTVTNVGAQLSSSANTQVVGIYAETGTASSSGGPWIVQVDFIVPEGATA